MPAKLDDEIRGEIVRLRALDYDKQEIAEELGVSRNTVSRHLQEVREEAEESGDSNSVVLEAIGAAALGAGAEIALAKLIENLNEEGNG